MSTTPKKNKSLLYSSHFLIKNNQNQYLTEDLLFSADVERACPFHLSLHNDGITIHHKNKTLILNSDKRPELIVAKPGYFQSFGIDNVKQGILLKSHTDTTEDGSLIQYALKSEHDDNIDIDYLKNDVFSSSNASYYFSLEEINSHNASESPFSARHFAQRMFETPSFEAYRGPLIIFLLLIILVLCTIASR